MTPYRETITPVPVRPVLTRWRRFLVWLLSPEDLSGFDWYRAHVGGRWCLDRDAFTGEKRVKTAECPREWSRFTREEIQSAAIIWAVDMHAQNRIGDEHRACCTCEVWSP